MNKGDTRKPDWERERRAYLFAPGLADSLGRGFVHFPSAHAGGCRAVAELKGKSALTLPWFYNDWLGEEGGRG